MPDNQQHIQKVSRLVNRFQAEREPERLREAYLELNNVNLQDEKRASDRTHIRTAALAAWMSILNALDENLIPGFDPQKGMAMKATPPGTDEDGRPYPPGTDPQMIKDPKARAAYEKMIVDHRKAIETYRLQVHLSRLDEPISTAAKMFIRISYAATTADQDELKTAIEHTIKYPSRMKDLLKLFVDSYNRN